MPLTMADIKRLNAAAGYYFFERKTMRFFASRVESKLYNGRVFITSEKRCFRDNRRCYTVRLVEPDYSIKSCGTFDNIESARATARAISKQ